MKKLLTIFLAVLILSSTANANDILQKQAEMLETDILVDAVPSSAKPFMKELHPAREANLWEQARRIVQNALSELTGHFGSACRTSFAIFVAVVICAVADAAFSGTAKWACSLAGAAAIVACCAGDVKTMAGLGRDTVYEIAAFSKLLIPVMAAATASTGAITASAALQSGAVLIIQLMTSFFSTILVPAVYTFLAFGLAGCAQANASFKKLQKFLGNVIKNSMRIVLLAFSGFLSVTGIISGSADAFAVKATKMAVSSAVPVIGGMVADATETVLVSAGMLKNSVGIFGMLTVFSVMIVPFLRLAVHYLLLQATEFICCAVGSAGHADLIGSVSSTMGYLLAMVACCGLMVLIACICFMKVATP